MEADKRAHHNALERKRRDHIKDSFSSLRDAVPSLQNEKVASRAQILKKASDYIQFMRRKNSAHQKDIDDLKRQNALLESQTMQHSNHIKVRPKNSHNPSLRKKHGDVRFLEKAKASNAFSASDGNDSVLKSDRPLQDRVSESESEDSDSDTSVTSRRAKKLKVAGAGLGPL